MVHSNSYKIVNFSKKFRKSSFLNLVYKAILHNQLIDTRERSFLYGYSRNFYRNFPTQFKSTCLFSGRNRGVLSSFHMSRISFKKFAMTGVLSGFKKSRW